ncbi:MAG: hypothetical protein AB1813_01770 [Verrucomicrobiota bacterium]
MKQIINRKAIVADVARDGRTGVAATGLRMEMICGRFLPRKARSSQPWALGRNPVGILYEFGPFADASGFPVSKTSSQTSSKDFRSTKFGTKFPQR